MLSYSLPQDPSQVDVVQSVGRVMRLAQEKKIGYVILPIVIPTGLEPDVAMDDSKTYRVVWQVLNAICSPDDRFDAMINKMEFNGNNKRKMEVIALVSKVSPKAKSGSSIGKYEDNSHLQNDLVFEVGEIGRALCEYTSQL